MADPVQLAPKRRDDGLLELQLPDGQIVVGRSLDELIEKANQAMRNPGGPQGPQAPLGGGGPSAQAPLSGPPGGGGPTAQGPLNRISPYEFPPPEVMQAPLRRPGTDQFPPPQMQGPLRRKQPWDEMFGR